MKKFYSVVFFISVIIIGLLSVVSFFAEFAIEDSNGYDVSTLSKMTGGLFYILRFPAHVLLPKIFVAPGGGSGIYWVGLLANTILYSLLAERFFYLMKKRKNE